MNDNDVNGAWIGQYTYGDEYYELSGASVLFSMEMTVTDGDIKGNCFDNDHPFDEAATITGNVENGLISFVKRYPHAYTINAAGQFVLQPDEPSHEVHYNGEWTSGVFTGHWSVIISESEGMMEFAGSGTWTMQRP